MASNTSQRKAQSLILASKVGTYATWALLVSCRPCNMPKVVPMASLPPDLTVMQTLMRMRCQTCGGRVEAAAIDNQVPGWRSRVVRVWGPGSYGSRSALDLPPEQAGPAPAMADEQCPSMKSRKAA